MPSSDFGLSFAPTGQNEQQNQQNQTPIQDAIKVLSLRIPSFHGARSPIPNALLQASGAAGMPGGGGVPGGLEEWLRRLFSGGGMPGSMTPGSAPPPAVRPGDPGMETRIPMPQPPQITAPDRMPQPRPSGGQGGATQPTLGRRPPFQQLP